MDPRPGWDATGAPINTLSMHQILTTLEERSGDLIHELSDEVGLTEAEAVVFLREAGRDLVASYVWHSSSLPPETLGSPDGVRALLAGMSGHRLAPRVGLTSARTWHGLRALVPAVLRANAGRHDSP